MPRKNEDLYCFLTWLGGLIWRKYLLCQAEFLLRFLSGDPIIFTVPNAFWIAKCGTATNKCKCRASLTNRSKQM